MARSSNIYQPMSPLSAGNVVSAGLRIYRDHFKQYYSLALQSYLWLLIPIYGWAKFSAIQGLISRLAFGEVSEHPESIAEVRRQVYPKLWTFFLAGLLVFLMLFFAFLGILLVTLILAFAAGLTSQGNIGVSIFLGIVAFLSFLVLLFGYIWLYSRLSIVELPIAIEPQTDATTAIGRSWNLTKGFVLRLQLIFFVAFLITLPLSLLVNLISAVLPPESPITALVNIVLSVLMGALLIPFWQSIKAVIYYDLRSRNEGLGLEIKDALEDNL